MRYPGDERATRAPQPAARPPWLIDRDLDAVAAHLDPWILAADPDHDVQTTAIPLLGTPAWVVADEATRNAAVALYVTACLAEREPVVIAARLAAEIAAGRTAYLVALRQASHAISEGMFPAAGSGFPHEPPRAWRCRVEPTYRVRTTSLGGGRRRHAAKTDGVVCRAHATA